MDVHAAYIKPNDDTDRNIKYKIFHKNKGTGKLKQRILKKL